MDREIISDEEIEKIANAVINKMNLNPSLNVASLSGASFKNDNEKTVTRSFKIYKNVLDDFVSFCNNSKYTQYELLSRFISEGIEKYS